MAQRFRHLPRSIPAITNLRYQRWFFWDGRAERLWAQAIEPLENPREMNSHRLIVVRQVVEQPALSDLYRQTWAGDAGTLVTARTTLAALPKCYEQIDCQALWDAMPAAQKAAVNRPFGQLLQAIESYELTLTTSPTRFDRYVHNVLVSGNLSAPDLTPKEREGMSLFFGQARCVTCHSGRAFSDGGFHNLFLPAPPGRPREDAGRFAGIQRLKVWSTNSEAGLPSKVGNVSPYLELLSDSWGQFKTPSLRNLGGRREFMHNGVFNSLNEVLRYYNRLDTSVVNHHHTNALLAPLNLNEDQLQALEEFLKVISQPIAE